MNRTTVVSVTIAAVAIIICFSIYSANNRYTTVNAGNGRVYKVDRRTGESVLIVGTSEIPVQTHGKSQSDAEAKSKQPIERELIPIEIALLTGRAGLSFGNYYSGHIYNGAPNLTITELEVTVTTTIDGKEVSRTYRDQVSIQPLTTGDFGFDIVVGDKDASYKWFISGAKGRPVQ